MTDRLYTTELCAAQERIGAASSLVRSARMAATAVQLEHAALALEELAAAQAVLKAVLGK